MAREVFFLLDLVAILIVIDLVGLIVISGTGGCYCLLLSDSQRRICHICRTRRRDLTDQFTDQLDRHTIFQRTSIELDRYMLVFVPCVDSDRILRIVCKTEVRTFPCNSSICSLINISTRDRMVLSFIDLQVCLSNALVEHGVCLTDTTAELVSHIAVKDTVGHLKAFFLGTLSDMLIKVEALARLEHETIDTLADQPDIGITVIITACLRCCRGNEAEIISQELCRSLRFDRLGGNRNNANIVGIIQSFLGIRDRLIDIHFESLLGFFDNEGKVLQIKGARICLDDIFLKRIERLMRKIIYSRCVQCICGYKINRILLQSVDRVIAVLQALIARKGTGSSVIISLIDDFFDIARQCKSICSHRNKIVTDLELDVNDFRHRLVHLRGKLCLDFFFRLSANTNTINGYSIIKRGDVDLHSQFFRLKRDFASVNIGYDDLIGLPTQNIFQNGKIKRSTQGTHNQDTCNRAKHQLLFSFLSSSCCILFH